MFGLKLSQVVLALALVIFSNRLASHVEIKRTMRHALAAQSHHKLLVIMAIATELGLCDAFYFSKTGYHL